MSELAKPAEARGCHQTASAASRLESTCIFYRAAGLWVNIFEGYFLERAFSRTLFSVIGRFL